jgi:hypothetical protein
VRFNSRYFVSAGGQQVALPKGLEETVKAFFSGCEAKKKETDAADITLKMVGELFTAFKDNESTWEDAQHQIKAVAGLSGRLAAAYAEHEGKKKIEWSHALMGLKDGKAECQATLKLLAKHCAGAFE